MRRKLGGLAVAAVMLTVAQSATALGVAELSGTKCSKVGASRTVRGVAYLCARSGKSLKWKTVATGKTAENVSTTTTPTQSTVAVSSGACRTTTQIYERLPNELQKREWESVVEKLQPIAASADSSGKTTAVIDTYDDTTVGNLTYGRYYPQSYPKEVAETQGRGCTFLALVLDVFVRFTGSDTSDSTARYGIQSAVKSLLQEVLAKYTKVDGYDVDVVLIEPVLDHCPGRQITVRRTICPWNDVGFLYFRTAALTASRVAATPVPDVFSLGVQGAMFLPRPFDQIVGIGASSMAVVAGELRNLVPIANKSHQQARTSNFPEKTLNWVRRFRLTAPLPSAR